MNYFSTLKFLDVLKELSSAYVYPSPQKLSNRLVTD